MILGVGTDIVQVDRFESWQKYSTKQLLRVFSEQELDDCLSINNCNFERLASRFAAKEAFFKAFSSALVKLNLTNQTFSFLFSCMNIEVIKGAWDVPKFTINWESFKNKIKKDLSNFQVDLSISHEKNYVVAFVIISL